MLVSCWDHYALEKHVGYRVGYHVGYHYHHVGYHVGENTVKYTGFYAEEPKTL